MNDRPQQGFQLIELAVALAVASLFFTLVAPPLLEATGDLRVRLAAFELLAALREARSLAIRTGGNVAVKFRTGEGGAVTYALYRDGDGDGVLNRDIDAGVDPEVRPARPLAHFGRTVRFGFPPGRPARDPGDLPRRLPKGDPIRFNRSDLASFGPLGTSTPGSLYVTDGRSRLAAVRVYGRTGKVKVIAYDFDKEVWR